MGTQPLPKKGAKPPIFGPYPLSPNGWMDQDGTWHGGGPWSRPRCTGWRPSSPSPKRGQSPAIFGPFLLWSNGWMHQDATWYEGRPPHRRLCVRWGPSPLPKRGRSSQFSAHVYCGQTAGWIKMPLGTEVGLGPDDIVLENIAHIR